MSLETSQSLIQILSEAFYDEAVRSAADFLPHQMGRVEEYVELYFHNQHVFQCFV